MAAVLPTLNYVITRVTDHFKGGPKHRNADEAIKLYQSEVEKLKALAQLDVSEGASSWVMNIRALMRPAAASVILVMWSIYAYKVGIASNDMMNMASAVMFYLFGERVQMRLERKQ